MRKLAQGSIVLAEVADPRGENKKDRPVLIVTASGEIASSDRLVAVAVSHTAAMQRPRPDGYVALPFHPQGRTKTGLMKESVAVCRWKIAIEKTAIKQLIGFCHPPRVLEEVLIKARVIPDKRTAAPTSPSDIGAAPRSADS